VASKSFTAAVLVALLFYGTAVSADVRSMLESELNADMPIAGEHLVSEHFVDHYYAMHEYQLVWREYADIEGVIDVLEDSIYEGLMPADYHVGTLKQLYAKILAGDGGARLITEFDLLLTDAVVTYALHQLNGKVDPSSLSSDWDYSHIEVEEMALNLALDQHIKAQTVADSLANIRTNFSGRGALKALLKRYLDLGASGDFEPLKVKPNELNAGTRHSEVAALARRLVDLGDLDLAEMPTNSIFSKQMFEAVKRFQARHQLPQTGRIDKPTLRELNTSYETRADRIRVNLERGRWISHVEATEFIVVNVPSFDLHYFRDQKRIWQTNVVVGKDQTKTPIFTRKLRYIEFNPTWTVPRSIIPSIIEKTKADRSYFTDRRYYLVNNKGQRVDGNRVNWSKLSKNRFPYWVVQEPWENNALGQVKFMFPNEHAVYLHDTPAKGLFNMNERAFSHGCIRVSNPMKLAEIILSDKGYDEAKIRSVVSSRKTTRVNVGRDIDILLMYWTAFSNDGVATFHHDIYGRDEPLLKALKTPLGHY